MKPRRVKAMAWKELLHVLRDPRSPILAFVIPVALLLLFGSALALDVDHVPLAVWDRADTPGSRQLVAGFVGSRYFDVSGGRLGYPALERAVDRGEVKAFLVVPADFGRAAAGRPVVVQLVVDGSDPAAGALIQSYAAAVVERFAAGGPGGLEVRPRMLYNPDQESKNAIVPGLIAMILSVIAALLTSLTIAREWETGTMEQLIATPVTRGEVILGKLTPYFAIGMIDVAIAVGLALGVFHVPLRGNPLWVFVLAALFLLATLGLGLLISIVTRAQLLASQVSMVVTLLPSFLLSGLMFPIASMPVPLQYFSGLFPARYFVQMLLDIFLEGQGIMAMGHEVLLLAAFTTVVLGAAVLRFDKRLG